MTLHTYTPNQCPYQVSTSYTLWFLRYSPDKIFKLKVTTARSKVTPSHCTPTPPNQCPYQVSTSYTLQILTYNPDKLFPAARPPDHYPLIRIPWVKTILSGLWGKNWFDNNDVLSGKTKVLNLTLIYIKNKK